jgi:hypothetical protein
MQLGSALAIALSSAFAAAQTTWYVDVNGTPPGSGTQADPYTSIQYAISRPTTVNGDTVLVAPGTYLENVDFLGKAIQVSSSGGAASTTIDANNVGSAVTFANGEGLGSSLVGFTVRRGVGTGAAPFTKGGGIYCNGASPILADLVMRDNVALTGAGVYLESSSAQVLQCTMRENHSPPLCCGPTAYGVGAYVECGSNPLFDTCTFQLNHYGGASATVGGGVFGAGTYVDCLITDNVATRGSGVAGSFTCSPTLTGCTIQNNMNGSAEATADIAGGVYGPATLTSCAIKNNRAWFSGGGAYGCTLTGCEIAGNIVSYAPSTSTSGHGGGASGSTLVDCNVHDNVAQSPGGPIHSSGGGIGGSTATRCRIWRNFAEVGAGADSSALDNCTVYGNTAATNGGGYTFLSSSAPHTIHNSILWGNAPNEIDPLGMTPTVTYSDVAGGYAGTGNIALDPRLWAPLSGDFHLKAGSPCIDSGDPSQMDPDNSRIDMGVYPFDPNYCGSPGTYCTAKVNSHGCSPAIGSSGTPSISGADNFFVTASQELNQRSGLMIWSTVPATQHVLGGILCVHSFKRTPAQNSGGSALPTIDCSGTYSYFFSHAYMSAQSVTAGTTVYAQYYGRDPFISDGSGASLSNGLEFAVCP